MRRVPRIQGGRWIETGELGGHRLAHHDSASLLQAGQDGCVVFRHKIGVHPGAGGCGDSGGVEDVLDPDGDTVQRPGIGQRVEFALTLFGVGQHGLAINVDPGRQRFQRVGAGQQRLGHIYGADLPRAYPAGHLGGGEFMQFGHLSSSEISIIYGSCHQVGLRPFPVYSGGRRVCQSVACS